MPRQRVDIVRDGVTGDAVYDRARAAKEGTESTGHALPAANPFNPWLNASRLGPIPLHVFIGTGDSELEEMIAETERGLYITRFWYTRTVHPREAVVTGMTRDGTFLIEHGELTTPVRNLRFTQSYVEALAGTEAVGREARHVWAGPGIYSAPALKLTAFNFTGTTEF
jgi:predicted Zn-dependent protease